MASKIGDVVIDCADPTRLAEFWKAVLGWQPVHQSKEVIVMADPSDSGPMLVLLRVPEAKTVKNRVHIDVNPVGCTVEEEVERLVGLGARRIDIGQGEQPWVVMADPEGNEFCVCPGMAELKRLHDQRG
jgi:predicted enzyme related to lactoylglutathione lyase